MEDILGSAVYELRVGGRRGWVWHEQPFDTEWLVNVGPTTDSELVCRLARRNRLLPTAPDFAARFADRAGAYASGLLDGAPALRADAERSPGSIIAGRIGGRVAVRVCATDDLRLTVAVSHRLVPGSARLPPDWFAWLLAAFFPDRPVDELAWTSSMCGAPLGEWEEAYCDG